MRWVMLALFLGSGYYIFSGRGKTPAPLPPEPPAMSRLPLSPILPEPELRKVRASTGDTDPAVRWAAIELLYTLKDPQVAHIIETVIAQDVDPEVKSKTIRLLKDKGDAARAIYLVKAIGDPDKGVRLAAISAIGDLGDPAAAAWLTGALQDYEPEVKVQALRALGRLQERRIAEFNALAEKLRKDYEEALEKRKKSRGVLAEVNETLNTRRSR